MPLAVERTGYEGLTRERATERYLDQLYRRELLKVRWYHGDLDEARRLYQMREVARQAMRRSYPETLREFPSAA